MSNEKSLQWETPNPIEAFQEILGAMQTLEQNFHQSKKIEEDLNNRQSDLLHALELDLDDEELEGVNNALREIRIQRREIKNLVINLSDAKDFIVDNYKFMNGCSELIKKMQSTSQKLSNRKYFLRDCEAITGILKMERHSDIIHAFIPLEERFNKETECKPESMVEKFNRKHFNKK